MGKMYSSFYSADPPQRHTHLLCQRLLRHILHPAYVSDLAANEYRFVWFFQGFQRFHTCKTIVSKTKLKYQRAYFRHPRMPFLKRLEMQIAHRTVRVKKKNRGEIREKRGIPYSFKLFFTSLSSYSVLITSPLASNGNARETLCVPQGLLCDVRSFYPRRRICYTKSAL